jgi:hypothetical protein
LALPDRPVDSPLTRFPTFPTRQRSGRGGVADLLDRNLNLCGPGAKPCGRRGAPSVFWQKRGRGRLSRRGRRGCSISLSFRQAV